MRVLIACEFSGIVREAFKKRGHDAWSCDLLDTEVPGQHLQCDVLEVLSNIGKVISPYGEVLRFDLMIFHWPCTNMAVSGARWFKDKKDVQEQDIASFKTCMESNVPKICGENPISVLSTRYRKPDQIIQPWQFGHPETKATCLWLKNLPPLKPTNIVEGRANRVHREPPGPDRWKNRSRTLQGIAEAMASQWG